MKKIFIKTIYGLCFLIAVQGVFAQNKGSLKYIAADKLTIIGKSIETENIYHRLDTNKYKGLPPRVTQLLAHTAGLAVSFKSNSTVIAAKWCVSKSRQMPYLTPIANKGLDLYVKNGNKWQYVGVGKPASVCNDEIIISHMDNTEKEFLLYLPLYDVIRKLEIGIEPKASIKAMPSPFRHKVLIYGSSIVQGAGASRSGLAYPAKLSRLSGINFINLGLSGSAKMEPEVADVVASLDADAYILDCVPNTPPQQVTERTAYLVKTIRKNHPKAPIIVMQSVIREQGYYDKYLGGRVKEQNINIQKEVLKLLQGGIQDLYFITSEQLLGADHEGSIDGTHPNDLGYDRMVNYLWPRLKEILSKYDIN